MAWSQLAPRARTISFLSTAGGVDWELPPLLSVPRLGHHGPEVLVFLAYFSPSLPVLTLFPLLDTKCFLSLQPQVTCGFWHLFCCC